MNRLDKEELEYELSIRGCALGNCGEMRGRLSSALQMEKSGDSLKYPDYPYKFEEDYEGVKKRLEELIKLLPGFSGDKSSSEAAKISTKLNHTFNRLDHMMVKSEEEQKLKSEQVALALSLREKYEGKVETFEGQKAPIPSGLSFIERQAEHAITFEGHNISGSSALEGAEHQQASSIPNDAKSIPPYKWNIQKFRGDMRSDISVNAFFEQIEELRLARNVSEETLLNSGIDLFCDRAYQFYKECRLRMSTWSELVREFRREYLSPNYEEELFREIDKRTQHASESIGVYLAVMSRYFQRLRCPITEETKLKIVLKNLHPYYIDRLRDPLPSTIGELREACRSIEARRNMCDRYVEPSTRRSGTLEKDLACIVPAHNIDASEPGTSSQATSASPKQIICYRCREPGHKAIGCVKDRKIVCFGCKKVGHTVRNCRVRPQTGNDMRRT